MESTCSTPSSSRAREITKIPHHLQQPSSSSAGPAVYSSSMSNLRPGQSYITVHTLTKENLIIVVNQKTRVHDVLWKCGEILEITEDKLFGLALRQATEGIGGDQPRHEYFFLDPAQRIFKYAPKQPRFANWHNRSTENRALLVLYFRVRVYIDQVRLITCPLALEHYYLQLKDNFLDQWAGRHSVSEERCWEMAALALKADKGDPNGGYFRAEQYFPMWVIDVRGLEYIRKNMPSATEDLSEMTRLEAMTKFCLEASRSPFALNCHLYGLRRHKMDSIDNAVLGVNAKGIEMCDIGTEGDRIPLRSLQWNKVTRLAFDRKKLTIIGADGTKMSLYAQSESKARYLLELCRAVHQTLLVLSHQTARIAPLPQPFQEKSVDRVSTSSATTSGVGSTENDKDCDSLSSACDRGQGSVSSKQRVRIKLDSNLDLKIEKMELENIRQDRATSQSSKTSEKSSKIEDEEGMSIMEASYLPPALDMNNIRPSSVDSASQTVESGNRSAPVDVNFNCKFGKADQSLSDAIYNGIHYNNIMQFQPDLQYASSGGSRSDSVQQSTEMIPVGGITRNYHHDVLFARSEDADSTLRSSLPHKSSVSLHDLRTTGIKQPPQYEIQDESVNKPRWTASGGNSGEHSYIGISARSEPKMDSDSDLWSRPSVSTAILDPPSASSGRLFTKRTNSGASRAAASINRVHSMPAHYHMAYQRNSPIDDYPSTIGLHHVQSMNNPRPKTRDPPPYDRALEIQRGTPITPQLASGIEIHPLPAEAANGQASFPPASATQFNEYIIDDGLSTERLRDFPMIHRLWRESKGMLNHQRRPSSCLDLSTHFISNLPSSGANTTTSGTIYPYRGEYVLDHFTPYTSGGMTINQNNFVYTVPSQPVLDLPPPPPYPSNTGRKAPMVM